MTETAPRSPRWLVGLLARCTLQEQRGVDRYRDSLRVGFDAVRAGEHTHQQFMIFWHRILETLEDAATGTPGFDHYCQRQRERLNKARTRRTVDAEA